MIVNHKIYEHNNLKTFLNHQSGLEGGVVLVSRRNLTVKGVGTLWEVGEERTRIEIPRVPGTGGNKKKFLQHHVIFCNRKSTHR